MFGYNLPKIKEDYQPQPPGRDEPVSPLEITCQGCPEEADHPLGCDDFLKIYASQRGTVRKVGGIRVLNLSSKNYQSSNCPDDPLDICGPGGVYDDPGCGTICTETRGAYDDND